nr:MAG TPA: 43 kDa tail protein [Caudoviricetes sp.]
MDYILIGSYQFDRDASKDDMRLDYCSAFQEVALDESNLSFDTVSAEVYTKTVGEQLAALPDNTPIVIYRNNAIKARFVKRGVSRIGPNTYSLIGRSPMGALTGMIHSGGIYTGQTVAEVAKEICGGIPILVKTVYAETKLYGWLPYANGKDRSARDNLVQVLFAIGAYLRTDLNGVLRIEPLWDGTASTISVDRSYSGGTVKYDSPISAVTVTEHQYIAGTDEKELFSGTSQQGDIITFSEPMHSLTATGFTILESGANYAKISSGSGSLKGKTYIHNTRLVTQTVTENAAENVKSVTDATLVSLVNSSAVAKRLADYYKCRETITNGIVSGQEKPGHVVSVYHPYDKKMVSACIVSLDTTMSGTLKSEMAALVGFLPPQPESSEYFDERVILTGAGEWTVPEGVTSYTRVLVGGGQGGKCGKAGALPTSKVSTQTETREDGSHTWTVNYKGFLAKDLPPAAGGEAGTPGEGGKVLVETVQNAVPGSKVSYSCGVGGAGAPYAENSDKEGNLGGATTMGGSSSDSGSSNPSGYTDPMTGEVYAVSGIAGVPGGNGVGYDADGNLIYPPDIVVNGQSYTHGGQGTAVDFETGNSAVSGSFDATSSGGLGGGPAYKANGHNGGNGITPTMTSQYNNKKLTMQGGAQGTGATAQPPEKPSVYGNGGGAGNGGGGNGQTGWPCKASCTMRDDASYQMGDLEVYAGAATGRGLGSDGGQGGDGCIIIYYRKKKELQSGWLKDKNGKLVLDRLGRRIIK